MIQLQVPQASELTTRVSRHTWTAARLQTLDRGAPVSLYTVARELGHGSEEMVRRVYAHLGTVRHRSEVVEFRVEQHLEALKDRLGRVGFVTRDVTAERGREEKNTPAPIEIEAGEDLPEWARRDLNARPLRRTRPGWLELALASAEALANAEPAGASTFFKTPTSGCLALHLGCSSDGRGWSLVAMAPRPKSFRDAPGRPRTGLGRDC